MFAKEDTVLSPDNIYGKSILPDIVTSRDIVKRRRISLDAFDQQDEKLQQAYVYWQSKRRGGLLPAREDIDIVDLRPLIGKIHLVDVSSGDPAQFHFRVFGSSVRESISNVFRNQLVGECTSQALKQSVIEDYTSVIFTGVSSYHQIVALIEYVKYSYSRLVLPLADDGRRVTLLMVCINKREFSDLAI
ncbi:MAG: PAS domain-containing protein [Rhodospirillales bacterium]|nr:PAS domain-containing protein [Rhodospirillales bacterium]